MIEIIYIISYIIKKGVTLLKVNTKLIIYIYILNLNNDIFSIDI